MPGTNTKKRSRCPNGERRNPKTGECEKKSSVKKVNSHKKANSHKKVNSHKKANSHKKGNSGKKKSKKSSNKTDGTKRNKLHNLKYLIHLVKEGFFNDISRKLYSRDYKRTDFIPLSEITLVVPDDMELQYDGDRAVGTQGHPQRLFPDDSANWYEDSKKLKENDIVYDESESAESHSNVEAWLVVKRGRNLGLLMFPMDDGSHFDQGFSDGDTANIDGQMIHPVEGNLVQVF